MNNTSRYAYDGADNLVKITNPLGNETALSYDCLDRLTEERDVLGNTTKYEYGAGGNISRITYPRGNSVSYGYDLKDRLVSIDSGDGRATFLYNGNDLVTRMASDALEESYTYDSLSRMVKVDSLSMGKSTGYAYDEEGNVVKITDPEGREIKYSYDGLDRVVGLTDPEGLTTEFTYDGVSNITKIARPSGVTTETEYDGNGKETKITTKKGGEIISSFRYAYDYAGNIVRIEEEDGESTTCIYDPLYRLKEARYPREKIEYIDSMYGLEPVEGETPDWKGYKKGTVKQEEEKADRLHLDNYKAAPRGRVAYEYDGAGNITSKTDDSGTTLYTYDRGHRLISAGDTTFSYDDNGNVTKTTEPGKEMNLAYNNRNELVRADFEDGTSVTYEYDGYGRKTRREETYYNSGGNLKTQTDRYLHMGRQVLKEYDKGGEELASYYTANGQAIARKMYGYHGRKPIGKPVIQPTIMIPEIKTDKTAKIS